MQGDGLHSRTVYLVLLAELPPRTPEFAYKVIYRNVCHYKTNSMVYWKGGKEHSVVSQTSISELIYLGKILQI